MLLDGVCGSNCLGIELYTASRDHTFRVDFSLYLSYNITAGSTKWNRIFLSFKSLDFPKNG